MKRAFVALRRTARPSFTWATTGLGCWVALLVVLGALLAASTAEAQLELYVANQKGESPTQGRDSIVVYQVNTSGNLLTNPARILAKQDVGDLTGLATPSGVAVIQDKLFVANRSGNSITVYNRLAQGNTKWETILQGTGTELDAPTGLAVTETELYVANQSPSGAPAITVYGWSKNGQGIVVFNPTTPIRKIKGDSTGLAGPGFIALDRTNDELVVSNDYNGTVTVYRRNDLGDQRYRRRLLAVGNTGLTFAKGVVVDNVHDELFLAYGFGIGTGTISVWPRTANEDLPPLRSLRGAATQIDNDAPNGIALDVLNNRFFVADRGTDNFQGSIVVHALSWDRNAPNQSPIERHTGPELFSPVALALFDAGNAFDFALTVAPQQVTVAPGSKVNVTVTARLLSGTAGRITFRQPLADAGAINPEATVVPAPCDFPGPDCIRTLTLVVGSTSGRFPIVVEATAAPTNCGFVNRTSRALAGFCDVVREASVTLTVEGGEGTPPTSPNFPLRLLKTGNGRCDVASVPAGLTCGLDQIDCVATFSVPTVTLTATPDTSSIVTGWAPNCAPQASCQVALLQDSTTTVRLTCDLRQASLTVQTTGSGRGSVTSSPEGITCPTDCQESYPVNRIVTLTAAPVADSTFGSWSGCTPSATNPLVCSATMSEARTVVATFNGPTLSVEKAGTGRGTVASTPSGIFCDPACLQASATFNSGAVVTLRAAPEPASNSRFVQWAGCTVTPGDPLSCVVTFTSPTARVTATFSQRALLTVENSRIDGTGVITSADGQIVCPPTCSAPFDVDTSVSLAATAGVNSIFAGWARPECAGFGRTDSVDQTDDASVNRPGRTACSVAVTGNTSVGAAFVGTLRQAFVARLYLNVLRRVPRIEDDINGLIESLGSLPVLTIRALIDAFFDSLAFRAIQPPLSPQDSVTALFRAALWREPTPDELDAWTKLLGRVGLRDARRTMIEDPSSLTDLDDAARALSKFEEFRRLVVRVFGAP